MPSKYSKQKQENIIQDDELLYDDMNFVQDVIHKDRQEKKQSSPVQFDVQKAPDGIFDVKPKTNLLDETLKRIGVTPNASSPLNDLKDEFLHPKTTALSSKEQKWCDDTGYPAGLMLAGFAFNIWLLWGNEYELLIPDNKLMYEIVAPLVRIYARTVKKLEIINPNYVDLAISLKALMGYAIVSYNNLQLISAIKRGETDGIQYNRNIPGNTEQDRNVQGTGSSTRERENNSSAPISRATHPVNTNGRDAYKSTVGSNPGKLTPEQSYQMERLSRLRDIDAEVRTRQFGFNGKI